MAKSLSRIMVQIEKLQKEAAAIQTGVIARIRKEISDHGLSVEHLFGKSGGVPVGNSSTAKSATAKKSAVKKKASKGVSKPPKFGDGDGNFWGGMGKRPDWVRSALAAGRSLEEFLIGGKKSSPAAKKTKAASKATAKSAPKVAKKTSGVKPKVKSAAAKPSPVATKPVGKKTSLAKKTIAKSTKVARKASSKKAAKAKPAPTAVQGASSAAV